MIEELKNKRYRFQEQIEIYDRNKSKLSRKEKFDLVNNLVKKDIFAYLELISSIVFDVAETSNEYIVLLETITEKVKNDLAQGPFLNSLKNIGIKKEKIAIKLYDKILKESKNKTLVVFSLSKFILYDFMFAIFLYCRIPSFSNFFNIL